MRAHIETIFLKDNGNIIRELEAYGVKALPMNWKVPTSNYVWPVLESQLHFKVLVTFRSNLNTTKWLTSGD